MPGMDSPWLDEVGLISAPVPQNSIFFSFPAARSGSSRPHSTAAEQPQPEAPAWASYSSIPQSW